MLPDAPLALRTPTLPPPYRNTRERTSEQKQMTGKAGRGKGKSKGKETSALDAHSRSARRGRAQAPHHPRRPCLVAAPNTMAHLTATTPTDTSRTERRHQGARALLSAVIAYRLLAATPGRPRRACRPPRTPRTGAKGLDEVLLLAVFVK